VVAYRAKKTRTPIDLAHVRGDDADDFWEPILSRKNLVLEPNDFYLLASKEKIGVPGHYAAEMVPYDPSIGEFTVHYAGFFDPGFGHGTDGEIKGTKAVLSARARSADSVGARAGSQPTGVSQDVGSPG
jgi:dCTP deaminase